MDRIDCVFRMHLFVHFAFEWIMLQFDIDLRHGLWVYFDRLNLHLRAVDWTIEYRQWNMFLWSGAELGPRAKYCAVHNAWKHLKYCDCMHRVHSTEKSFKKVLLSEFRWWFLRNNNLFYFALLSLKMQNGQAEIRTIVEPHTFRRFRDINNYLVSVDYKSSTCVYKSIQIQNAFCPFFEFVCDFHVVACVSVFVSFS